MAPWGVFTRYVVKEILRLLIPIWLGLGFLLFVLEWLAQVFNVKADAFTILTLYLYKVPFHLQVVFPVAVLFSCLLVLGAMNRANEIVAVQSMGARARSVLFPVFVAVGIASLGYLWVSQYLAPQGMRRHYEMVDSKVLNVPSRFLQVRQERIWYRNQDILYNVGYFNPTTNELYNLSIYTFDEDFHIAQAINARKAEWMGSYWKLSDGSISLVDKRLEKPAIELFKTRNTRLIEAPSNLRRVDLNADTMTQPELRAAIRRYHELGINTVQWEVTYHSRMSFLLIAFVFVMLAVPRALAFRRVASPARDGAFVAAVCMTYWLVFNYAVNLGNAGRLNPILAAWGPSVLTLIGVAVYYRSLRLKGR